MFGISLTEILLIAVVAIVVVGPQKLPRMLASIGNFIGKMRRMATDMRRQTGIDEILRAEGLDGGLNELRGMVRGNLSDLGRAHRSVSGAPVPGDPYGDYVEYDRTREYPVEGPDCYDAIPEDLAGSIGGDPEPVAVDEANADPSAREASPDDVGATGEPDAPPGEGGPADPVDLPENTKATA